MIYNFYIKYFYDINIYYVQMEMIIDFVECHTFGAIKYPIMKMIMKATKVWKL
jgi:hypothetical protein